MAKTDVTKLIERYLEREYAPSVIGGIRVNKMRPSFVGLEVPVECGTIRRGLVDAVRIDECFLNEKTISRCLLCSTKSDLVETYAKMAECPYDVADEESRAACSNESCRMMRHGKEGTAGILFTAFEIKVTVADFHSKHGHNFCGNCNFYVVPQEIYPKIKDLVPDEVGILVFYDGEQEQASKKKGSFPYYGLRKKKDCVYQHLSDEEQLWLLMSTMKRVVKGQKEYFDELLTTRGNDGGDVLPWA